MIRLNKYLAACGVGSRRKCDELILSGAVSVNDAVEQRLGVKIDADKDLVKFQNRPVQPAKKYEYYILYKPMGVVTTASDEKSRKTVVDYVETSARVFPVGRLDIDTTGLVLLTNDGDLTYKLTHPRFNVEKVYEVVLDRPLTAEDKRKLEAGIQLEEGLTSPSKIRYRRSGSQKEIQMIIHQGWKRQIRRMFAALDYEVKHLRRTAVATLKLTGLRPGDYRELTAKELETLKGLINYRGN